MRNVKVDIHSIDRTDCDSRHGTSERGPWSGARFHMRSMRNVRNVQVDINTVRVVSEHVPKEVSTVAGEQWTGPTAIRFNVASVQRPLAAASKVVEKGGRVVMEPGGGFIESIASGERIQFRIDRGVCVFDVKLGDGSPGVVALDSGAGVNVWPKTGSNEAKMEEKIRGLSMVAAN